MKKENYNRWETEEYLFLLVIFAFSLLLFFHSLHRFFDHDEFEAIHTAWKILSGETIYVDFFQHHHPLLYYLMAPVIKISGENIRTLLSLRIIFFILCILIAFITYRIALVSYGRKTALISTVLLLSTDIFFSKAIEIRPDVPQTLFGTLAIFYLIKYLNKRRFIYSILSGLFLGISFLFLQKAIFLIAGIMLILLLEIYGGKLTIKELFLYMLYVSIPILPYFIYLIIKNHLLAYIFWNWTINIKLNQHFSPLYFLKTSYQKCWIIWSFYLVGLFMFSLRPNIRSLCLLSVILLSSAFLAKTPYQQYYLPAIPLVAIISGYCIENTIANRKAIIYLILLGVALPMDSYVKSAIYLKNDYQLAKVQYVLRHTASSDYVYDGNILFNVFRKDIDYFWFSVRPKTGLLATYKLLNPSYKYNIYQKIRTLKPKIISNYYIDVNNKAIKNQYIRSPIYRDLYLRVTSTPLRK